MENIQMRVAAISFLMFVSGLITMVIPALNQNHFTLIGFKMTIPVLILVIGAFGILGSTCGVMMIAMIAYMLFPNKFNEQQNPNEVKQE